MNVINSLVYYSRHVCIIRSENRALDEKWKCHYKDTCVICRLNKTCRRVENVKKEKENKHGQGQKV